MSKGLLLVGAGGHARSCIDVIESAGLSVFGLLDRNSDLKNNDVLGYSIRGGDADLPELAKNCDGVLVTVGQIGRPKSRVALYDMLVSHHLNVVTVSARTAYLSRHATLGRGSIVMHHALVNAGARVGVNCIINSAALVEHDVNVGDHCHIAIGAILGGGARIGAGSFVGAGAIVSHGVSVGPDSIIGAGCVVMSDCPANTFLKRSA